MELNLGIVYKNGHVINHRSLLKVSLNPILRYLFGIQIVSYLDLKLNTITSIGIQRSSKRELDFTGSWIYNADDCIVKKERVWI